MGTKSKLLIALALLAGAADTANAAELIVNGGFEDGDFSGWTRFGAKGFSGVSTVNPSEGDYAAYFSPNSVGGISQSFVTLTGKIYRISFDLKHEVAAAVPVNSFSYSWGGSVVNNFVNFANFPYTHIGFTRIGGGVKTLAFSFRDARPTQFFLDNVSVTGSVPEPEAWAMLIMGFGLAGVALRRRGHMRTVAA